jgi:cell division protease FtsH
LIDQEVKEMVENAYERTKNILRDNKDKLELLANELLDKEVIFKENLEEIFGKRKWDKEEEKVEEIKEAAAKNDTETKPEDESVDNEKKEEAAPVVAETEEKKDSLPES